MNHITLDPDSFPDGDLGGVNVGDRITLQVEGVVCRVSDQMIDVTQLGGPRQFVPGQREVDILITKMVQP